MTRRLHDRRILVVDDDRDSAESLAMLLCRSGAQVEIAYDGVAALSAAAWFEPRAVLLDITMPGLDGYRVARQLRQRPGFVPLLVALTGWAHEEAKVRSRDAGFDHHIVKPVDYRVLESVLAGA